MNATLVSRHLHSEALLVFRNGHCFCLAQVVFNKSTFVFVGYVCILFVGGIKVGWHILWYLAQAAACLSRSSDVYGPFLHDCHGIQARSPLLVTGVHMSFV